MKEYTLDVHVKRLERMLMKKDVCKSCPATPQFELPPKRVGAQWPGGMHPCYICMDFVAMPKYAECPCAYYGPNQALTRTHDALAAYYRDRRKS